MRTETAAERRAAQALANQLTRHKWSDYSSHREHVTGQVLGVLGARPRFARRVLVLGSGNLNDLDLRTVVNMATSIVLLDIDTDSTRGAFEDRGLAIARGLQIVEHDLLDHSSNERQNLANLGRFDVVLSATVLTQLFDTVARRFDESDRRRNAAILEARAIHLTQMLSTIAADGVGLLVTDVVSSLTCPELNSQNALSPVVLGDVLMQSIEDGNFFTGANPFAIKRSLEGLGAAGVILRGPWMWRMGSTTRLACSLTFSPVQVGGTTTGHQSR